MADTSCLKALKKAFEKHLQNIEDIKNLEKMGAIDHNEAHKN